jgi:hypothetical protein
VRGASATMPDKQPDSTRSHVAGPDDIEAFERLYREYFPRVRGLVVLKPTLFEVRSRFRLISHTQAMVMISVRAKHNTPRFRARVLH